MANEKSKAEQYRDERKARIAKAAKKNAKGMEKRSAAAGVAKKVISIVLVAAIAIGIVGSVLNYYGAWERIIVIGGVGEDNVKVTAAEYEYYYMQTYNTLLNQISYYSYYGQDMGYDTSLPPDQQPTPYTDQSTGEEIEWDDYIREQVISQIKQSKTYYNEAVKAGTKLTASDEALIDKQVENYRTQASEMGNSENGHKYSLDAYLRLTFGPINGRYLRKLFERQVLISRYAQNLIAEKKKSYTDDEIKKVYNADKVTYDVVNFRIYSFNTTALEQGEDETEDALKTRQAKADAEIKKKADEFYAAAKDEKSFIAKATALNSSDDTYNVDDATSVKSATKASITDTYQLTDDIASWLFNAETKTGSVKLFTNTSDSTTSYYIVLLTAPMHQQDTVTVRRVLFSKTDSDSGEELTGDDLTTKKNNADDALKTWESGDKTEDSFSEIAVNLSEDSDTSSYGGLVENALPGQLGTEADKWVFDDARKAGDVTVIETAEGYNVFYYVSKNGSYYDSTIRSEKASTDIQDELTAILDAETNTIRFGVNNEGKGIQYAEGKILKKIATLLQMQSSNSASTSTVG